VHALNRKIRLYIESESYHSPPPGKDMARPASDTGLRSLVEDFVSRLAASVEAEATNRARQMVMAALGSGALPRRRGRPPKLARFGLNGANFGSLVVAAGPTRRRPKQLCPVPGCNNPAAPVFGMVCAKHKDVAKAQIKKYREARRAQKQKGRGKSAPAAKA
jgi:hypothetical protein